MTIKYTKDHEWVQPTTRAPPTVGITLHAQDALGDVVFVDLPEVGKTYAQGDVAGVVESVKAAADVFMPVTGEVTEVNEALRADPSLANSDPMGDGWFFKVKPRRAGAARRAAGRRPPTQKFVKRTPEPADLPGPMTNAQCPSARPLDRTRERRRIHRPPHRHRAADEARMLPAIGSATRAELIDGIVPPAIRRARPMQLPAPVTRSRGAGRTQGHRRRRTRCSRASSARATTAPTRPA